MFLRMVSVMKPRRPRALLGAACHDDVDIVIGKDEAAGRSIGRYLSGDRPHARRQHRRHETLAFTDQLGSAKRFAG